MGPVFGNVVSVYSGSRARLITEFNFTNSVLLPMILLDPSGVGRSGLSILATDRIDRFFSPSAASDRDTGTMNAISPPAPGSSLARLGMSEAFQRIILRAASYA